jgi:hypothetical protein
MQPDARYVIHIPVLRTFSKEWQSEDFGTLFYRIYIMIYSTRACNFTVGLLFGWLSGAMQEPYLRG